MLLHMNVVYAIINSFANKRYKLTKPNILFDINGNDR